MTTFCPGSGLSVLVLGPPTKRGWLVRCPECGQIHRTTAVVRDMIETFVGPIWETPNRIMEPGPWLGTVPQHGGRKGYLK